MTSGPFVYISLVQMLRESRFKSDFKEDSNQNEKPVTVSEACNCERRFPLQLSVVLLNLFLIIEIGFTYLF